MRPDQTVAAVFAIACLVQALPSADLPNVAQVPGTLLNGPISPQQGRTAIIAWHGGRIITVPEAPGSQSGADLRVRVTNISDPAHPVIEVKPYAAGGLNAHGYFQYGSFLWFGNHETVPGNGQWRDGLRTTAPGVLVEDSLESGMGMPLGSWNRAAAQSPWGAEMWWSYGAVSGNAFLGVRRSLAENMFNFTTNTWTGPAVKSTWDHLGQTGVIGMPFIIGNILIYASDQTGTGVATYDISDPAHPVLLDVLKEASPGGYWPEIYGHYIFFPRRDGDGGAGSRAGFMVVDFQDPTDLRVVANRNLPGSNQYVTFQDEFAFMNKYKIDLRTFDTALTLATNDTTLDASQFALPVGNLVVTGGYGSLGPGLAIWAHQATPDTRGPFVAYHLPKADQAHVSRVCPITLSIPETLKTETIVNGTTLIVRPVGGAAIPCWHSFGQGKLLTVTPISPLAADTTYEVLLTAGIQDAVGNGMEPYSFRFSTGNGLSGGNRPPQASALSVSPAPAAPGATIAFSATASDPDAGDSLQYRYDFGDGSARTPWSATATASHAYASARHYRVTVQVRDGSGSLASFSRGVTVVAAPAGTRPVNSSPIVVGASARRVWAVNPDANTLAAINADTHVKVWEQPTGTDPRSVALGNDGTLWVACHDADRIAVLDGATGATITSLSTGYGSAPVAICASPDGATMYASCSGDSSLRRFAISTRSPSGTLALGPSPRAIAITGNGGRALVTRFISGEHEGSVYDVNLAGAMTLTRTIPLRRHNYVQDGSASGRGVPNYLAGITITPDNARAWVVGKKDNTERGTLMTNALALGQDNTVRAQLLVIDLTTNGEDEALRMDIDNSESPTAVAFSPLADYACVALQGNNQVVVIDVLEFMRSDSAKGLMTRLGTDLAPQGLAIDSTTSRLFTQAFMGRTVNRHDLAPLLTAGNVNLPGTSVATVRDELLSAQVLNGKRIFYNAGDRRMSAEGYISCATCHVDGSHDGRTWDFTQRGEGLRNTTDLRGRSGTGHGAVHWSGNFNEIQDFENDIRSGFGGSGFLTDTQFAATQAPLGAAKAGLNADLDALAAYVASLGNASLPRSPLRQSSGNHTTAATSGQAVFTAQGCATCHVPANGFTDRTRHDVGTLRSTSGQRLGGTLDGIDTPTLLGLHASAPYFHNGMAATLDEVFTLAGGDLRQAESGAMVGGAATEEVAWWPMKHWHGGLMVPCDANGEGVSFTGIDGGSGGAGMVEVRYCVNYAAGNIQVVVNGTVTSTTLATTPNNPSWMPNEWRVARLNVTFAAGTANTVIVRRGTGGGMISLDEVVFITPRHLAAAQPHRRVQALTATDRGNLIAYLRELDVANTPATAEIVVSRGGVIADGGIDPAPSGGIGVGRILAYTIANTGTAPLSLGGFAVGAVSGCTASVSTQAASSVAAGTSTTLAITILPAAADWSIAISGVTNDSDENPTNWTIRADSGTIAARRIRIDVLPAPTEPLWLGESLSGQIVPFSAGGSAQLDFPDRAARTIRLLPTGVLPVGN